MPKGKINIYDYIGEGGITASDVAAHLQNFEDQEVTEIEVHINSYGGSVFEGFAIYNLLKSKGVVTYVDGIAASIASVIALAGTTVHIYKNAFMMIHNPWTFAAGDQNDLKKTQEVLEKIRDSIIEMYIEKTGKTEEDLKAMMDDEEWLRAEDALETGFADKIVDKLEPKNIAALYSEVIELPEDSENNTPNHSINNGDDKMNEAIIKAMGFSAEQIAEGVSDEAVLLKIAEMQDAINNSVPKEDFEKVEKELSELKERLENEAAEALEAEIKNLLDSAVEKFKINASDRTAYEAFLKSDFEAAKAELEKIPENKVKPGGLKPEDGLDGVNVKEYEDRAVDEERLELHKKALATAKDKNIGYAEALALIEKQ